MKTVFDKVTRDQLTTRISTLDENSKAGWGKMNIYQMLKHCTLAKELYLGYCTHKRVFLGRLIGKMALKGMLKNEMPMARNAPTNRQFIVTETSGDIEAQKKRWITLTGEYAGFDKPRFVHWFFGKMTREQLGQFVCKHTDHHLRQFNA